MMIESILSRESNRGYL